MYESRTTKEMHEKVFELTRAVYRVTDFFPREEALRKHLREKANEVFSGLSEYGYTLDIEREALGVLAKIESMRGYLELARNYHFVRPINIAVLAREYDFLTDFFVREVEGFKQSRKEEVAKRGIVLNRSDSIQTTITKKGITEEALNPRQQKILIYLKEVIQAKVSDFSALFGDISLKTIQRDLQDLVAKEFIQKRGDKRWTTYYINVS